MLCLCCLQSAFNVDKSESLGQRRLTSIRNINAFKTIQNSDIDAELNAKKSAKHKTGTDKFILQNNPSGSGFTFKFEKS